MAEAVGGGTTADDRHARRQIIARGAVAAGLIVALLAGLLIFERDEAPAPAVRTVTRAAQRTEPIATPAAAASAAIEQDLAASASASAPAPTSAPAMSPELSEAIKNAPDAAQAALASMTPSPTRAEPEATYDPTVPMAGETGPNGKATGKAVAPKGDREAHTDRLLIETPSRPGAAAPATAPNKSPASSVVAATPQGNFVVQMGVFANPGNAEELHARLSLAGIPSQIETRVQVGPFATREQALKAQEKLKTLGMGSGILVAAKKR